MSKVTRYDLNEDVATGTPEISPVPDSLEGPFVSYEDYAALEARVKGLEETLKRSEGSRQELFREKDLLLTANINAGNRAIAAEAELARLKAEPRPAVLQEWTDEQCLDFMSVAFRHAEISGDIEMDDIRLGMKIVNAGREIAE